MHTQSGHLPCTQQITSYLSILFCNPSHHSLTTNKLYNVYTHKGFVQTHVAPVGTADGCDAVLIRKQAGMINEVWWQENHWSKFWSFIVSRPTGLRSGFTQSLLVTAVWVSNLHSIMMESQFQRIITSSLLLEWTDSAGLAGNSQKNVRHENVPYRSLSEHHLLKPRIAGCLCVCVYFCANVCCLHPMFARLINSGAVVLRWHIVQASLSPHPNQINSECHLCIHTGLLAEIWSFEMLPVLPQKKSKNTVWKSKSNEIKKKKRFKIKKRSNYTTF